MRQWQSYFRRVLGLALALVLAIPMWVATPAFAAGEDFVGGPLPEDMPLYVPNDHTPQAIRFSASGLTPNTDYEVKIRLSPNMAPSGNENRGYTWNPADPANPNAGKWARNRGLDWGLGHFPKVKTNASGEIVQSPWMYFKFANESNVGTYYIIVTLNSGGDGTAQNAVTKPAVTVLDMKTNGTKVHTGAVSATTTQDERRAIVAPGDSVNSTATVWAITRTEANKVDDDSNGVVDDEDLGSEGKVGDYLMAAPVGGAIDVWVQQNRRVNDATLGGPDESIALGASDMTAPAKPTNLTVTPSNKKMTLSWTASTDTVGVTKYLIYRWQDTNSVEYTPLHELIGTTTGTTFEDDSTVVGGVKYNYEVRAIDAATNVSARSNTASATSMVVSPPATATVNGTPGLDGWYVRGVAPTVTLSGSPTIRYSWDDAAAAFTTYSTPLAVPEGIHTLYFFATDEHGNESDVKNVVVKYDATAPVPTLSAPTFSTSAGTSNKFSVNGEQPSPRLLHRSPTTRWSTSRPMGRSCSRR